MDGYSDGADGTACFAHGLAHLIVEHGFEEGLALAGQTVLDLLESGREAVQTEEEPAGHEHIRRFGGHKPGTDRPPARGVRPSMSLSSMDAPAGPTTHPARRAARDPQRHVTRNGDSERS